MAAASPLTVDVDGPFGDGGTVLDGGSLTIGNITNTGQFVWRSGDIAAEFTNNNIFTIETSSPHKLSGKLTNNLIGSQSATLLIESQIDDSSAPSQVIAENNDQWFMSNGANITSQQSGSLALFKNMGDVTVRSETNSPASARIDAAMQNFGTIDVQGTADAPATLTVTAKTGAVSSQGELVSGIDQFTPRWGDSFDVVTTTDATARIT